MSASAVDPLFPVMPPGQDELPYDDGEPMESWKHRCQMNLLIETLALHLGDRSDVFIGGNMALYYSILQARKNDFKAPDFFVVLNAIADRERKSWVVWEENGRTPDVVIELLSESTERNDRGRKKQVYAGLKVSEYYLFDPHSLELEGFRLKGSSLEPFAADADGTLECRTLGLRLGVREGSYLRMQTPWLRWLTAEGALLPSGEEQAREAQTRAEEAEAHAERLAARLRALGIDPED